MLFQRILKGVPGIHRREVREQLNGGGGLICNWWHRVNPLPTAEIPDRLTEQDLVMHLNGYDQINPTLPAPYGQVPFGEYTPFISATCGTVERDPSVAANRVFSAFLTALWFATNRYRDKGVIYHGYVNLLGRRSVKLQEFAEETRDLHQWVSFQPYHPEGEVVAKITIPSPHLEKADGFDGPAALNDLRRGRIPGPSWTEVNAVHYVPPETVCNVRGWL
jgi:hypothetical protein